MNNSYAKFPPVNKNIENTRIIRKIISIIALTGSILAAGPVQAALLVESSSFGIGSITFDTDTNLKWLDLPHTLDYSYNELQPEFGTGGVFDGYRLATGDEVYSLFVNAGIPHINVGRDVGNETTARALMNDFIGQTGAQNGYGVIFPEPIGITADLSFGGTAVRRYGIDMALGGGYAAYSVGGGGSSGVTADFTTIGAWLVQGSTATVPEPSTIALFSLGLLGLGFSRKLCKANVAQKV